jgi:hypothetical protein
MAEETLSRAIALINLGKKTEAQKMLEPFIESNPQNIQAWLWEVETWPTIEAKVRVLETCLRYNPDALQIKQALAALKSKEARGARGPRQENAMSPSSISQSPASQLSTRSRINGTKFLDTTGVSYHLQQLINQAQDTLILISPYLKINERLRQALEDKDRMKIDIRIVYGKSELQPDQTNWLKSLRYIRTSYCENLHAKCYLNENEAIVTSMNLYEFSQVNNQEMGLYITRAGDAELYSDVYNEAWRLIRISDEARVSVKVIPPEDTKPAVSGKGYCIRCKKDIALNPAVPYCVECYIVWKKYGNWGYQEKYCHRCGKDSQSTMNKPVCLDCFKQSREKNA